MYNLPPHIKRDCQQLSYDRTMSTINNICDTFGRDSETLACVSAASLSASFLMFYSATRLHLSKPFSPSDLLRIWGESMEDEFDLMQKGYDVAEEVSRHGKK